MTQPSPEAQAVIGESGVTATGVAQEYQRAWSAYQRDTRATAPRYTFAKADRRMTCQCFYLRDEDPGSGVRQGLRLLPLPAKIWANGHGWAKREALVAGIERNRGANRQRVTFTQMIRL